VKCPNCNADFDPDSTKLSLSFPKRKGEYKIYHQECPTCNQIILGVREYQEYTDIYEEDYQKTMDNLKLYRMI
jgi:hypothetical protein